MRKVLLVDHSGRGHTYADLFTRTNPDVTVFYAPGCAAITTERVQSVPELTLADPQPMVEFAKRENVDFVFVANAMALAKGFVDVFREGRVPVIGPDKAASRLEASKSYTKQLCAQYQIPIAEFEIFDDAAAAKSFVQSVPYQVVVKAEGLCGGNGSFVCDTPEDALNAIDKLMVRRDFDEAGDRVVIEKRLYGREFSFFALVDGQGYKMLPLALDYPKSDDGNEGITCGGMGAFSPHPLETEALTRKFQMQLLEPLLVCIESEGLNYNGVIYVGCMLVEDQFYLLEVNARMGDPEAEVVLPRVESDFLALCDAVLQHSLDDRPVVLNDLFFCDVVATQGRTRQISDGKNKGWYVGWPYGRYGKYYKITGVDQVDQSQAKVFIGEASVHPEKGLVTDGGRVIHVVGYGASHHQAVEHAYANIGHVQFNGIRYRHDIGKLLPWDTSG